MRRLALTTLVFVALLAACEGFNAATRKGQSAVCNSDRDCLYGLVCRGSPAGVAGERQCIKEQYSRCKAVRDCFPGRACNEGYCEVQCIVDADCAHVSIDGGPPGFGPDAGDGIGASNELKCVIGECRTGNAERQCLNASDCPPEQDCMGGRCVTRMGERCVNDFDCQQGRRCIGGTCR